jgi:hypothetical protein
MADDNHRPATEAVPLPHAQPHHAVCSDSRHAEGHGGKREPVRLNLEDVAAHLRAMGVRCRQGEDGLWAGKMAPTQHLCHEPPLGDIGLPSQRLPQSLCPFCRPAIILSVLLCGCQGWRTHPGWPVMDRLADRRSNVRSRRPASPNGPW